MRDLRVVFSRPSHALRACGRTAGSPPSSPFTSFLRCASVASVLSVASLSRAGARGLLAAVPRVRRASRDYAGDAAGTAEGPVDLRSRRRDRSSAAIADGVVYVGSGNGELHAVNLADGKAKWKYKASEDGIGESSPAVAGGLVYIGDLAGVVHAVDVEYRQGGVDVQDRQRDEVLAGGRRATRC